MDKSPEKIKEMFNKIAKVYDFNNNLMSLFLHKIVKVNCLKTQKFSGKVLDLCSGTGDIAGYIFKHYKDVKVYGCDFSVEMLKIAQKKYKEVNFIEADAIDLPFEDNYFDFVVISFGFRNIDNYEKALDEINRVLKPNGKFMHIDFGKKNIIADKIFDFVIPKLIKIFYKNSIPYDYLIKSKQLFFNEKELITLFRKHGLKFEKSKTFLFGGISCQTCSCFKP